MKLTVINVRERIHKIRGQEVILDKDLANFYQMETKAINQVVRRNPERFPTDFAFQLTRKEARSTAVLDPLAVKEDRRGGRRTLPYGFTYGGIVMLSGRLRSERAAQITVLVIRAFGQVNAMPNSHADLTQRLDRLEQKFDQLPERVLNAIKVPLEDQSVVEMKTPPPQFSFLGKETDEKINSIQESVARYFGLKKQDFLTKSRSRTIALPRQIAIFLIRKLTQTPFEGIGKIFGGKDHTTALYAYRKISAGILKNDQIREAVAAIESTLRWLA